MLLNVFNRDQLTDNQRIDTDGDLPVRAAEANVYCFAPREPGASMTRRENVSEPGLRGVPDSQGRRRRRCLVELEEQHAKPTPASSAVPGEVDRFSPIPGIPIRDSGILIADSGIVITDSGILIRDSGDRDHPFRRS